MSISIGWKVFSESSECIVQQNKRNISNNSKGYIFLLSWVQEFNTKHLLQDTILNAYNILGTFYY